MTIKELIAEVEAMFDELKGLNDPEPACYESVHAAGHMGCWTPVDRNGQSAHDLMICSGDILTCGECAAELLASMPASELASC